MSRYSSKSPLGARPAKPQAPWFANFAKPRPNEIREWISRLSRWQRGISFKSVGTRRKSKASRVQPLPYDADDRLHEASRRGQNQAYSQGSPLRAIAFFHM